MNYDKIVSICREKARDFLRMLKVNQIKDSILELTNQISFIEKRVAELLLNIKRSQFKVSKLDNEDPDKEAIIKKEVEYVDALNKDISNYGKESAEINVEVTKYNEDIAKVQSGEYKVCKEALSEETDKMIKKACNELMIADIKAIPQE